MRISININRPDEWYQGTRIVITDGFYGVNMSYNPYYSTDYNTKLGANKLLGSVLFVDIPDNYIKQFLNTGYKIVIYALAYDGVIDISQEVEKSYYMYSNSENKNSFFSNECSPDNGEPINVNEQKFIEKNVKTNNVAYDKFYKFVIAPTETGGRINNITLNFTYEYSENCDIDKYLNRATQLGDAMAFYNTIIYDGISETFEITSVTLEDLLLTDFGSKLDKQLSNINYKSKSDSDYSPVLTLDALDKEYTFLGWYKIDSNTQYKIGDSIQFSSLFNGFVSSQKVATFDYNKLNNIENDYVYFFAVYSSQKNEIIPFENRKMRIMKAY